MSINLYSNCSFWPLTKINNTILDKFDCTNQDLNEFFKNDALKYSSDLLGKTYCFTLDKDSDKIVCMFTVSNDSLKADDLPSSRKNKINMEIARPKQRKSYPAVLIGRLGVAYGFSRNGIGTQLMNFIKGWFLHSKNKTGCRFVVVDSYNTPNATSYYLKNEFTFLFSTERQEKNYLKLDDSQKLNTRMMYFDLLGLKA